MKVARIVGVLFGVLGVVLMLGTVVLCLTSLDAPVELGKLPEEARMCPEEVLDAIASGDFAAASSRIYGQPDFGADLALTGEAAAVWEIFTAGISYEFTSDFYVVEDKIAIDAVLTVPAITSITDTLNAHAARLMEERIASATEISELYDEDNNFRQDLIDEVLAGAVELAFAEQPETLTFEMTLKLVSENGKWWVVPDAQLLKALSGGLA